MKKIISFVLFLLALGQIEAQTMADTVRMLQSQLKLMEVETQKVKALEVEIQKFKLLEAEIEKFKTQQMELSKFQSTQENYNKKYSEDLTKNNQALENYKAAREEDEKKRLQQYKNILDAFADFSRFYGDKYSVMTRIVAQDALSAQMRTIVNPQSGALGFKLEDKVMEVMTKRFEALITDNVDPGQQKDVKEQIKNSLQTVNVILKNDVADNIIGMIPYGSNVKSAICLVSSFALNILSSDKIKFKKNNGAALVPSKIQEVQTSIIADLSDYIAFYNRIAKVDYDYQIKLKALNNDLYGLDTKVKEFALLMQQPLMSYRTDMLIDTSKSVIEITHDLGKAFDAIGRNETWMKDHLAELQMMSVLIQANARSLHSQYRTIQDIHGKTNNDMINDFQNAISESPKIAQNANNALKSIKDVRTKITNETKSAQKVEAENFQKYLQEIYK